MTTMNVEIYDALLQAKFPEKPARTIATVLDRETKKEAIEVKTDLKENVQGVKTDLKEDIKEVKADIKTLDKRFQNLEKQIVLIKWMLGVVIVAVVIPILQNIFGF